MGCAFAVNDSLADYPSLDDKAEAPLILSLGWRHEPGFPRVFRILRTKRELAGLNFGLEKPEDILGENGLLKQLTKAPLERAMQAEMTDHPAGNNSADSRNGGTTKTPKGVLGKIPLEPFDTHGRPGAVGFSHAVVLFSFQIL
jgi:hypothetical protein